MNLPSYFKEFLSSIEPSPSYKEDQASGHQTLRRRLAADSEFGAFHVNTFLQGSYKRNTAVHPGKDVDIVVVTALPAGTLASDANAFLKKCLDKYYAKVTPQHRSQCVTLSYVTMDVIIATSPQLSTNGTALFASLQKAESLEKADAWTENPLWIPDRDTGWVETHPKKQLAWTTDLNAMCGGYFVPLVKMFKWWRQQAYTEPKYPKGYVLERLAGACVDTTKRDHAEGFVALLENIYRTYAGYAAIGLVPNLPDAGVPTHNVAHRLSAADFQTFIAKVGEVAPVARAALEETSTRASADKWRKLFGGKFPSAPVMDAAFPSLAVRPNKPAGFA